jgi:CheY-like chemotaxis protein
VPLGLAEDPSVAPLRRSDLLAGLRALVVDDNHTNRVILHDQLEAWGMSVDVADGGATALAMLGDAAREGRPFDVGVLDLCMPEMDGLDLARRITAGPDLGAAGLVLLTSGLDVSQTEARASGFAASMTKPVQLSRLRSTLQDIVGVRRERAPAAEVAPAPSARGRILVVEDGEINQLVATGMLEHFGYTVDVADDGFAALAAIRRTTYDAVLMDVQMPGMDGYEATSEIRSIEGAERRTPIIAMTAGAVEGDRERCLAAGMDDYLSKPIDLAAVGRVVAHWVPAR